MTRSAPVLAFGCRPDAVRQEILRRVRSGELPVGSKLPATAELAAQFQVSKDTISRAMRALAESGVIERRRGAGTVIAAHARNGAASASRNIGICLPMLTAEGAMLDPAESPTWFRIFNGAAAELDQLGYTLSILPRTKTPLAEQIRRHHLAGVLLPNRAEYVAEVLSDRIPELCPCLFLGNPGGMPGLHYQEELDETNLGEIFAALQARGFRRFGVFSSAETDFTRTAIWRGFRKAVAAADGYSVHCEQPIPENAPQSEYDLALDQLLALPEPPEVLVVVRSRFLAGVQKALAKRNLKVPGDISLFLIENDGDCGSGEEISGARLAGKAENGRIAARGIVALAERRTAEIRAAGPWSWHDGTTLQTPSRP